MAHPSTTESYLELESIELARRYAAGDQAAGDELARRQEALRADTAARLSTPPAPTWDEAGFVRLELVAVLVAAVVLVMVAVAALVHFIVGAAVVYGAYRHLTRHTRRRPRSSWSSLATSGAALFAAWNSRWLKVDRRVTVPARAVTTPDNMEPAPLDDVVPF